MTTTQRTESTKNTNTIKRVGLAISKKKWHKHLFSVAPIEPIHWIWLRKKDLLDLAYVESLSLDLIIHKMSDFLYTHQEELLIHSYLQDNVPLLDSIHSVSLLYSRIKTCVLLKDISNSTICLPPTEIITKTTESSISTSSFSASSSSLSALSTLSTSTLHAPLILKPDVACSTPKSHSMTLIFNTQQIRSNASHILQQYIPHHGILCKVYCIFDKVTIRLRKSLTIGPHTFKEETLPPLTFDSQTMKKEPLDEEDGETVIVRRLIQERQREINAFSRRISERFGNLRIFGWDLIFEEGTGRPFIIDLNYFPGFDDVDLINTLTECLLSSSSS